LQRVLPGISTEQLRSRLNRMVADGMLTRQRYREVPPRVDYELTERARELAPVLGELARWGYEWAWGPPRPSERVDLGAIFRLIPGLVGADSTVRGTVELTVSGGDADQPTSYMVTLSPGSASISERTQGEADAQIEGSTEAWIQALSPRGALAGLRTAGNRGLAETLLSILALSDGHRAERASVAASA
jgi:HxlR-like helix-turn-helix